MNAITHITEATDYVRRVRSDETIEAPEEGKLGPYTEALSAMYEVHQRGGPQVVLEVWPAAVKASPDLADLWKVAGITRKIIHASRLKDLPPLEWYIEGMIPKRALCEIHGAPGTGKSLFCLELAAKIARKHVVFYVAAEGITGYASRIEALEIANEAPVGQLYFDFDAVNLLDRDAVQAFIAATKPHGPAMIVFDTLARCMVGGDENSSTDMGLVVNSCKLIQDEVGCSVLLVHHTVKSNNNERGSGALRGGVDSMIQLTNDDGLIRISSIKLKDGKPFETYFLQMEEVGDSVVLKPSDRKGKDTGSQLSESQQKVLQMLELEIYRSTGAAYKRIQEHTGLAGSTLDRVLSALKKKGFISQAKRGEPYKISDMGVAYLDE